VPYIRSQVTFRLFGLSATEQVAAEQVGQETNQVNVAEQAEAAVLWPGLVSVLMHYRPHWILWLGLLVLLVLAAALLAVSVELVELLWLIFHQAQLRQAR
jgi:hypothetical protein